MGQKKFPLDTYAPRAYLFNKNEQEMNKAEQGVSLQFYRPASFRACGCRCLTLPERYAQVFPRRPTTTWRVSST